LMALHLSIKVENAYSDGHGIGRDLNAIYTVTVLESPDHPELVGLSNEWG
jgi:hypothetical protein